MSPFSRTLFLDNFNLEVLWCAIYFFCYVSVIVQWESNKQCIKKVSKNHNKYCRFFLKTIVPQIVASIQDGPFRDFSLMGMEHKHETWNLSVIPYLKMIQKINKSLKHLCWHQHFFTGSHQILIFQEIQI